MNTFLWRVAARRFIDDCRPKLWLPKNHRAREYLFTCGLHRNTFGIWWIGFNDTKGWGNSKDWGLPNSEKVFLPRGIVVSCIDELGFHYGMIRCRSGKPRYKMLHGSRQWLFGAQTFTTTSIGFLFESELDMLLAWQMSLVLAYASFPAGQQLKKDNHVFFDTMEDIIVAYDQDKPGQFAADKLVSPSRHIYKAEPLSHFKDITEYNQGVCTGLKWLIQNLTIIECKHED